MLIKTNKPRSYKTIFAVGAVISLWFVRSEQPQRTRREPPYRQQKNRRETTNYNMALHNVSNGIALITAHVKFVDNIILVLIFYKKFMTQIL
jgi:hypothetical protein